MASPKLAVSCTTMSEYEELALAVGRGVGDPEQLKQVERHVLICAKCRETWSVEELLRQLPGGVWETHLDTLRQTERQRDATYQPKE
jgi:hypothetical protein